MYVFFFFLSDESSNIYNKIINGSKIMKHNFIILRKYLKIFWWKKKKKNWEPWKEEKEGPTIFSINILSNHVGVIIFNMFTTMSLRIITQKLKFYLNVFSKYII